LAIATAFFAAWAVMITPEFVARIDGGYFARERRDPHTYVTATALRLRSGERQSNIVCFVGASSLLHAVATEKECSRLLSETAGTEIRSYTLCAPAMTVWEMISVVDCISPNVGGAIVLNVNPVNLCATVDKLEERVRSPLLGIPSEAYADEVRRANLEFSVSTGNYFIDHGAYYSTRLWPFLVHTVTGPIRDPLFYEVGRVRIPDARFDRMTPGRVTRLNRLLAAAENEKHNLEVLSRMFARLKDKGSTAQIILLESAWNPRAWNRTDDSARDRYRRKLEEFAVAHGAQYWSVSEEAQLKDRDFHDFNHIGSHPARLRFTEAIARRLGPYLQERISK
jgi:hypothetical protein